MRLTQVEGKEETNPPESKKPSKEDIEALKEIQKSMHKTMLEADLVLRRIAQILDKY